MLLIVAFPGSYVLANPGVVLVFASKEAVTKSAERHGRAKPPHNVYSLE